MMTVSEMMTTDVLTLKSENTLADVKQLMDSKNIRHVPIVDENKKLVGLVSHRDYLAAMQSNLEHLPQNEWAHNEHTIIVKDIMKTSISTIHQQDDLKSAAKFMQKRRFGSLPVVVDDKLVGIITDSDFVSVAINLMEQLEAVDEA